MFPVWDAFVKKYAETGYDDGGDNNWLNNYFTSMDRVKMDLYKRYGLTNGPRTLTDVARETGLSKATTFRILASLGHQNLVVREEARGAYMLGLGFIRLTQGMFQGVGAVSVVSRATLADLRDKTGETITIHRLLSRLRCRLRAAFRILRCERHSLGQNL